MSRNSWLINLLIIILLGFVLAITGLSIVMPVNFMAVKEWLTPLNLTLSSIGVGIILVMLIRLLKRDLRFSKVMQYILTIALILCQLYIAFSFVDYGRADSFYVRNQAYQLAHGHYVWQQYFKIYPNNVFCTIFYSLLIRFSIFLHLSAPWQMINIIQFIWLDLGLLSSWYLLKKWHQAYLIPILTLIWMLCAPFYSYALFVYTDIWVLPIPLMVAALITMHPESKIKKVLQLFLISCLLVFAGKMKANFWILTIALFLVGGIFSFPKKNFRQFGKILVSFLAVFLVMTCGIKLIMNSNNSPISPKQALPITHWIAMGSDPKTHGDYARVLTTNAIALPTKKAREKHDLKLIKQNLKQMGFIGVLKHGIVKLQLLTSSGTFDFQRLTKQWQKAPQWFYKARSQLKINEPSLLQIGYIILLIGTFFFLVIDQMKESQLLLAVFMVGLLIFHSFIWESEERYGLPILPIIILFGIMGTDWISERIHLSVPKAVLPVGLIACCMITSSFIFYSLKTDLSVNQSEQYVSGQIIGSYLENNQFKLDPNKRLITTIALPIKANQLVIDCPKTAANTQINACLVQGKRIIAHAMTVDQLNKLSLKNAHPGKIKLIIKNMSASPIKFAVGQSSYPIAISSIDDHSQKYLQYKIYQK